MAGENAFGVAFARGDGAVPEVFTALAAVNNVGGPSLTRSTIDVTAHDSPNGWMEFVGGLKDGGEVTIDVNYMPAAHDSLIADFNDKDPRNYRLTFPDDDQTQWGFPAIMTGFQPTAPVDDKLSASLTFKVAGEPTFS
ncbi:outer capsid protein Hoc [Streptomyces sp. R302]|uniref:phage tail tube protein n=1 Tax=unclassified Streptomyces TaxID=2593676 RepID=UPI00145EBB20|nr:MULTISPECIES: phage tail tube protein [unclassified Streptomyces]NML55662.1 outer capsid protein Hoc [Streptomyces sp. R301]NML83996.1 outer capsid protein Hoc [Streptomyces sp. R302]